jgi:hypothetical protein
MYHCLFWNERRLRFLFHQNGHRLLKTKTEKKIISLLIDGQIDKWIDKLMDGWMDGWMNGWKG